MPSGHAAEFQRKMNTHQNMNLIINDKPYDYSNKSSLRQLITTGLFDGELDIVIEENREKNYFLQIFIEDKHISLQYLGPEYELTYGALTLDSNEIMQMIDSYMARNDRWQSMVKWKKKKRKHLTNPKSFYARFSSFQVVIILFGSCVPLALIHWLSYTKPNSTIVHSVAWDFVWLLAFSIASIGGYINWRHSRYLRQRNNDSWYNDRNELSALLFTIGFAVIGFIPIVVRILK